MRQLLNRNQKSDENAVDGIDDARFNEPLLLLALPREQCTKIEMTTAVERSQRGSIKYYFRGWVYRYNTKHRK